MNHKPCVVNSISVAFKRALKPTEEATKVKEEHRGLLNVLIANYMDDLRSGKATGIQNTKELMYVMKMDLLLMGEATERTDTVNTLDETRVNKVAQALDMTDANVQSMIQTVMQALNDANDEADIHGGGNIRNVEEQEITLVKTDDPDGGYAPEE